MAEKQLKSLKFAGLSDVYTIPEIDETLSVEGMAADAKAVGDTLSMHTENKVNPHGVTAEQVGAVPVTGGDVNGYLDFRDTCMGLSWTTADGTIIHLRPYSPENEFQLTMQNPTKGIGEYGAVTINTNGAWGFSHADNVRNAIGAAPAGYGLGGDATLINVSSLNDLNNIAQNGWYSFVLPLGQYAGVWMDYCFMRVDSYDLGTVRQTLYPVNEYGTILHRIKYQGVWGELECVNPPMTIGVEYRTTERHNGNPVYTKRINIGSFPETGSVDVGTGIVCTEFVRFHANHGKWSIPIPGRMDAYVCTATDGTLALTLTTTGSLLLKDDVIVTVFYTKL